MVLVGVHPVFTHVPPNSLRSTIATFIPASLKRPARDGPACPVPTMIASYAFDIKRSFLIPRQFARSQQAFCLLRWLSIEAPTINNRNDWEATSFLKQDRNLLRRPQLSDKPQPSSRIEPDKEERLGSGAILSLACP